MTFKHALIGSALLAATGLATAPEAIAQEDYLGEIKIVGFNFCPRGTAPADGQLLAISSNSALFSLYGTIYGGDGRTTFALPDLRGRAPIHTGQGPGLTNRQIGSRGGAESVTLNTQEIPAHSHSMHTAATAGGSPEDAAEHQGLVTGTLPNDASVNSGTVTFSNTGGTQAHNNMSPFQTVNYCVVLQGIYPSRN